MDKTFVGILENPERAEVKNIPLFLEWCQNHKCQEQGRY